MNITFRLLFLSVCFFICASCSKEDDKYPVVGDWELIMWTVGIPFDLGNNQVHSLNFLDKTACNVNETLNFNHKGIVTSSNTFNPEITIRLKEDTSDVYFVEEICDEGTIGFSTSYLQVDKLNIELNNAVGMVERNKLTLVYANAIKIYNEVFTEVIESKDLTLVYRKK
ncbi:MAG: hypothetical protein ACOH2D_09390 [Gelidibacter sp.]|uniref:hypothetical protein n=1 Tax=Gelidibacter sp. TaxID=2018083 RepID=UPI003265733F